MNDLFDPQRTTRQLKHVYQSGLKQSEPRWNFGNDILTQAFPTLINGLWYLLSPENVGKSSLQLNIGYDVLCHNPNAYWLDVSLDDSVEDRLGYLLARAGGIRINLIHQAGGETEEKKAVRKAAVGNFNRDFGAHYHLLGSSNDPNCDEESRFTAEWICEVVQQAREKIGTDAKLFVTVDSFHDVDLQAKSLDENDRMWTKSKLFKRAAAANDALFLLTAHTRKDSRKRGLTSDATWGTAHLAYDARIMSSLYSDVNMNREKASVFWVCSDEPHRKMDVLELDIIKNKSGRFKDVIYCLYQPERCFTKIADETEQVYFRNCVYNKGTT